MNTITNEPLLKRQARIRPRKNTLVSCSNPLSVIEEEDSGNLSSSSSSSSKPSCSNSRHDSRAALLKSARRRANIISDPVDPFSVTFTQVTYPFPHPPLPTPNSFPPALSCPSSPSSSSSASSSPISSPYSHTSSLPTSPESGPCSYDEDDIPLLSCTRPLVISKRTAEEEYELIDRDLEEEYHYYSQEFNKIISLASLYEETTRCHSRPESVFTAPLHSPSPCIIPPRPVTPPSPRRNRPASLNIVRPPPRTSLPVPADLDSEESANVLMYYLDSPSSSSLSSGSVYSTYSDDHEADDRLSLVDFEFEMDQSVRLRFPLSVPCSPIDLEADIREGLEELHARSEVAEVEVERTSTPSGSDAAPSAATWSFDEELEHEQKEMEVGRTLRSKWSTSTLGSVKEPKSAKSRVLLFSPKKMKGFSFRSSTGGSPTKPLPEAKVPETPYSMLFSPTSSHFSGRKEGALRRRSSTSTNGSSTDSEYSGCSEGSSGLRRKPIPIELFMKT